MGLVKKLEKKFSPKAVRERKARIKMLNERAKAKDVRKEEKERAKRVDEESSSSEEEEGDLNGKFVIRHSSFKWYGTILTIVPV